jgi:hypothetical protein
LPSYGEVLFVSQTPASLSLNYPEDDAQMAT